MNKYIILFFTVVIMLYIYANLTKSCKFNDNNHFDKFDEIDLIVKDNYTDYQMNNYNDYQMNNYNNYQIEKKIYNIEKPQYEIKNHVEKSQYETPNHNEKSYYKKQQDLLNNLLRQ